MNNSLVVLAGVQGGAYTLKNIQQALLGRLRDANQSCQVISKLARNNRYSDGYCDEVLRTIYSQILAHAPSRILLLYAPWDGYEEFLKYFNFFIYPISLGQGSLEFGHTRHYEEIVEMSVHALARCKNFIEEVENKIKNTSRMTRLLLPSENFFIKKGEPIRKMFEDAMMNDDGRLDFSKIDSRGKRSVSFRDTYNFIFQMSCARTSHGTPPNINPTDNILQIKYNLSCRYRFGIFFPRQACGDGFHYDVQKPSNNTSFNERPFYCRCIKEGFQVRQVGIGNPPYLNIYPQDSIRH